MDILICIPFVIRNYIRATAIKLSGWKWALYTFLAMFVANAIGTLIQFAIMTNQDRAFAGIFNEAQNARSWDEMMRNQVKLNKYWLENQTILSMLFIVVSSIGGYLFIRHLLIKRSGGEE